MEQQTRARLSMRVRDANNAVPLRKCRFTTMLTFIILYNGISYKCVNNFIKLIRNSNDQLFHGKR